MGAIFLTFFIVIIIIRLVKSVKGDSPMRQLYDHAQELQATRTGIFSGVDPLAVAVDAFMNKAKTFEEVNAGLKAERFSDEHASIITQKAHDIYLKWLADITPAELAIYRERIAKIKDPLPDHAEGTLHQDITLQMVASKKSAINLQFLMGDSISKPTGQLIAAELAIIAAINMPVKADNNAAYYDASFDKLGGSKENPFIRSVLLKGENAAIFPYLKTEKTLLLTTKLINEYNGNKNYNIQAEVEGVFEGGGTIGFFAADYSVNKEVYKSIPQLNVRIAGFAASVSLWGDQNSKLVDQNYVGFSQNSLYGLNYYNFVGRVLKIKGAPLAKNNPGCILTLLLDNGSESSTQLIIDVFVNNDNIKVPQLAKEMKVEGLLCFQGEIA